jgi:predicted GH43/DUF377 family glycosyl hydrolase
MGLYYAYLETANAAYKTAMQDAATFMIGDAGIRSAADLVFLMRFQDLPGVTADIYKDAARSKFDGRISTYGSATALAEYIRDARAGQGYENGIIPWDIGAWVVAAQMLEDRYPSVAYDYAKAADDMAEVIYQDSFEVNPGYFNLTSSKNNGWDPDYGNPDYYWYSLGITGLIDAFVTADVHVDEIDGLLSILSDCQYPGGAFSYCYGANPDDEDWQSTAYAVASLARVDQAAYQVQINGATHWLGATQDGASGGWVYGSGNHYPETSGECTAAVYFGQNADEVWIKTNDSVLTGSRALDPVVLNEAGTYKMWYTHVDNSGTWTIYYADSTDGVTWSNQQQVLAPSGTSGAYDEVRVAGPSVINVSGTYMMWFSARDANAKWTVGHATSSDGLSWSKVGKVLDVGGPASWDSAMVREPSVIKDGSTYKMWYAGTALWPVFKIGYATSLDGMTWTKHGSNPIFTGTSGGWDGFQVYAPSVVLDNGTYHMYFSGTDNDMSQKWSTGHATSGDGISWTEASRKPILIPDGTDDSLDYVGAMNDGGIWKLWYSHGGNYVIGLATLTGDTQLWLDPAVGSIPNDNATTKTFTVHIANAVNLYGYQFVITFDKNTLEATAAAFDDSFFDTPLGSPSSWDHFIDNVNGKVYFARTRQHPQPAVNGSGPLATVTFKSKSGAAAGSYKINFEQNLLSDIDGNPLDHSTQYAWLTLYGRGTLQGSVDLQGRANESGGTVTIMNIAGYLASTTIAAADGSWSFANIPAGVYQVNIEMARYLDAQKGDGDTTVNVPAGSTITLGKVKLLGGDADDTTTDAVTPNPDAGTADVIDIGDAVIIGGQFGKTTSFDVRADINNDVKVDILDLSLMGGNYTKVSPVPWP